MAPDDQPRLRSDAQRNRDRLLAVARAAFTSGRTPSIEAIAREAGVGVGTLYRNYPTREALVEAVYSAERDLLCAQVEPLLAEHQPAVALRAWMDSYADFVTTKRGMAATLRTTLSTGVPRPGEARTALVRAVETLTSAGVRAGTLREDVCAEDVVVALVGIVLATDDRAQAGRLMDLLAAGLHRSPREARSARSPASDTRA